MRDLVAVALWRDMVGFIPVYASFLAFGLWVGGNCPGWDPLLEVAGYGWWLIPAMAAAANYLEDASLLIYLHLHEKDKKPGWSLTLFSSVMFAVKWVSVSIALAGTLAALVGGTFDAAHQLEDWRAKLALLVSSGLALVIAVYLFGLIFHFFAKPKTKTAKASNTAA